MRIRAVVPAFTLAWALWAGVSAAASKAQAAGPGIVIQEKETELSKAEDREVRATVRRYFAALQKKDYTKAGAELDRDSFFAAVDPMIASVASDSTHHAAARRKMFGVSTADSLAATPVPVLFASLMRYFEWVSPEAAVSLAGAEMEVLATRKHNGRVHVAYELTVTPTTPGATPIARVTALQMKQQNGRWAIVFSLDD
jgi:hypothetical protein